MNFCCADKDTLIAYIYGECDAETRAAVDAHVAACPACADEVSGFGVVREALSQWTPPGRAGGFRLVRDEEAPAPANVLRPARWWRSSVPALARVAAAILLVAGGAALANLEVRYDKDGFAARTGWQRGQSPAVTPQQVTAQPAPALQPVAAVSVQKSGPPNDPAPWRAELAALQRQMREEVRLQVASAKVSAPAPSLVQAAGSVGADENRIMQRFYTALDESERRQQVNVASYMSRLVSDLQAGRAVDMRRIGIDALPPAAPPTRQRNPNVFDVTFPVKK